MSFPVLLSVTVLVMLTVIVGMGIGVLFGRRALQGSCGGLNNQGRCALCSGQCPKRRARQRAGTAGEHQE